MVAIILSTFRVRIRQPGTWLLLLGLGIVWAATNPQGFLNLWLTPDQQGRLWFEYGDYQRAERSFENPRWRGMSLYAAEDFYAAAQYFSQYQDAESLLARANSLAQAREYLDARDAYEELAARFPEHPAPTVNIPIIQELIDANRKLSESQVSESGDMSSDNDDGPRSSEGDERLTNVEREQLSADQLLEDPGLTAMWLRQVQRNPSEFLSTKFDLQLRRQEAGGE
ncbi:tetratricopeptide repeat protein [Congregibacter sp.]|uniref:tetratricopeptide repeat protein n=1 Tax=Congregibacter sp. TaxID=2744308 RepID=UPI003F6CDEF5